MKKQYIYRGTIGLLVLTLLVLMSWSLAGGLALAQEPDDQPTATPTLPPPPADLDEANFIDPPSEEELGAAVQAEGDTTRDDNEDQVGGVIDIFDLSFVASYYGTDYPAADLNLDGTVDILDLSILAGNYNQPEAEVSAASIAMPPELPQVAEGGDDFGAFELPVEASEAEVEAQAYYPRRPLRIGVSLNYFRVYDYTDSGSAPDPYSVVGVDGVTARTNVIYETYEAWPYWRLGWWRYSSFPWAPWYSAEATYYNLPITIELRDYDGYHCYGYYGCRELFEWLDISSLYYRRAKTITFYPASCMAVDEAGARTYGYWLDANRCRVNLQSWGSEWPRAYLGYHIDAMWE